MAINDIVQYILLVFFFPPYIFLFTQAPIRVWFDSTIGTHGDRGILIFPVQLTTSRIGNLTRLIHTLLYVVVVVVFSH